MSSPESSLLCRKCHTPFFDDIPRHPDVDNECLRSNRLPSEAEEAQLRAILEVEAKDLDRLDDNIRRLRLTLEELERRRDALRQTVQRRQSWISPIRRLPVEIIGEIFSHACLGDDFSLDIGGIIDPEDRCPFDCISCDGHQSDTILKPTTAITCRLSHVCCWWMEVIVASPHLWSSLRLNLTQMKEGQANLVNFYLSRSQQHPLRVHVCEHPDNTHIMYGSVEEALGKTGVAIMSSVLAELYRCREFHYDALSVILLEEIDPTLLEHFRSKGMPVLSIFKEDIEYAEEEDNWFWDVVKNSPKLTSMSVRKLKGFWQYPKTLQILSIKDQKNCEVLLNTLSSLPNLQSLHLHGFFPAFDVSIPPVNLDSPNLHDLVITTRGRLSQLDHLFSFFSLPALSSLSISTCQRFSEIGDEHATNPDNSSVISYRANQLTALCALIRRSRCSLSSLTLHVEPFPASDIISLLEPQPSLNELELEIRQTQSSTCFADLCSRMSQPGSPLLPHLRHLSIHEMSYVDQQEYDISDVFNDATHLLDMLGSREMFAQSAGSGIKDVLLKFGVVGETAEGKRHELPATLAKRVQLIDAMGISCSIELSIWRRDNDEPEASWRPINITD